jgi:hypothetical protein
MPSSALEIIMKIIFWFANSDTAKKLAKLGLELYVKTTPWDWDDELFNDFFKEIKK